MLRKRPETLALIVALVSTITVLTVLLADLLLARQRDIDAGERRLERFSMMMAEHSARSLEAVDVLLREMASDLGQNRQKWEDWDAATGWEYVTQRHSRAMPQLRDLAVYDRYGNQRFISTYFPPPKINIKDRPYFIDLENGIDATSNGPYVGRNSGRYTYALTRRIKSESGQFKGAVLGSIEPAYLQDFCWANRLSDDFEAVLMNAKSKIVASCRPSDISRQSSILGASADDVLFPPQLKGIIPAQGVASGNGLRIAVSLVPGFTDLRILTAIPEKTLISGWHSRLYELATLSLLVTFVLIVGALLIRRQVREMASITDELAASHEHLEERVREATAELAEQKNAAERANRAKSRFLAAASHDLRQPLHALSLFSADLQRQLRSGKPQELPRLAEQISTSTQVLGELLDSLLDISRLDVAGVKPDIRSFPLGPLLDRLAASFRRAAVDRKQLLRIHPSSAWLQSDPVLLERIIANLISNAIRYTPPGGRILIGARHHHDTISIEVRDNGTGIAPEHQAAIFAEFYQVGNAAREQNKGLGLGLSIVDRLARALQIKITLNSRIGEGTTFVLHIPRGLPERNEVPDRPPLPAGQVHLLGDSATLRHCAEMMANWNFKVSQGEENTVIPANKNIVFLVEEASLATLTQLPAKHQPLIVLSEHEKPALPEGAHSLSMPVKPARLRALLNQLQKAFEKSTP